MQTNAKLKGSKEAACLGSRVCLFCNGFFAGSASFIMQFSDFGFLSKHLRSKSNMGGYEKQ